ncbi:MAG: family 78 glycoside hydrolase catalytic domain [Thermoproteota archaeon]
MKETKRRREYFILTILVLLASEINVDNLGSRPSIEGSIFPKILYCEYSTNPLGVETTNPRFSWVLESSNRDEVQTAYQILVSDSISSLCKDMGNIWDSKKVNSNESINVVYNGKRLESDKTYYWKVRVWDREGRMSNWSEMATFHTGLLNPEDWKARWIQSPNSNNDIAPLFRKKFDLDKPIKEAYLYISGLGYYECYINGIKVGNSVLDPGTSEYDKMALYVTYNVTRLLEVGANAIGVILGNGWFSPPSDVKGTYKYSDRPKLIAQLNVKFIDGSSTTIVTDSSWKTTNSPILYNSIWNGEVYDARLEKEGWNMPDYDDSNWSNVEIVPSPTQRLVSQVMPPIRVVKTIKPVRIINPAPGVYVFDFGQNFAGWAKLIVKGPRGTKVTLRYAEILRGDGTIYTDNLRSARATDIYILNGNGTEIYEPKFTYHGFRYVEVTGFPGVPTLENLEGRVVHSDVEKVGNFISSDSLLNEIQENILWTQLNNLMSIPTDCPQRDERMGWMGDAQLSAEEAILNFWMPAFYENWVHEITVAQREDGAVPDVVPPHWKIYPADPAWGTACILIPWYLYLYYGDKRILNESYSSMKKWVDFLTKNSENYIIEKLGKYGDWCEPGSAGPPKDTPVDLTSTGYYYYDTLILSKVAGILGKYDDAVQYLTLAKEIEKEFNNKFFKQDKNQYATGSQTSNLFPLFLNIVPEDRKNAVIENLVNNIMITHKGHLDTGIIGTKLLADTLTDLDLGNIMYTIVTQTTYPSWGYWIKLGATTLWERWEPINVTGPGMASYDHIMFGSIGKWFYANLAGIQPINPGYSKILIKPYPVGNLTWVRASVRTIRGIVNSSWILNQNVFHLNVTIPCNTLAIVSIPKMQLENITIKENGTTVWSNGQFLGNDNGIHKGYEDGDRVSFEVGSGTYSFELTGSPMDAFKFLSLRVSNNMVEQNEPISIYVTVENLLSNRIVKEIKLYVNNVEKASKYVVLGPNEVREVSFKYTFNVTGNYEIKVDNTTSVNITVRQSLNVVIWGILIGLVVALLIAFYLQQKYSKER